MSPQKPRTNDQFRKAIGKLVKGLEKRDNEHKERRRHNRYSFDVKVNLYTKNDDNYLLLREAWAQDLSIGGIACLVEQAIDPDAVIFVGFEELIGKPCFIPVQVRTSRNLVGSVYQINGAFAYPDELETEPP